jgi:DNA-binding Lrp family transcriptional regulator
MEVTAAKITPQTGVTHVYHRGWTDELPRDSVGGPHDNSWPNLWFTLAAPAKSFDDELNALRDACAPFEIYELPALKRFKIDVVFDVRTRDRDEKVEPRIPSDTDAATVVALNPLQQSIVKYFEGDIPVVSDFYGDAAEHLGIPEGMLMKTLSEWLECGVVRRIGMLLRHRLVGFKANGMCCWNVSDEQVREAGRRVASCREVTHCYERPTFEGFPFNLFAMIHTTSWEKTQELFQRISDDCGLSGGQLLLSVREFKKTSMQFFS